jgi:hypothetical protein
LSAFQTFFKKIMCQNAPITQSVEKVLDFDIVGYYIYFLHSCGFIFQKFCQKKSKFKKQKNNNP